MTCCDLCLDEDIDVSYKIDEDKFDFVATFCSYRCAQKWQMNDEEIEQC